MIDQTMEEVEQALELGTRDSGNEVALTITLKTDRDPDPDWGRVVVTRWLVWYTVCGVM